MGESGGVKLWQPMPQIFPQGMQYIQQKLGTPLVTHSKYYAPDNEYQTVGVRLQGKLIAVELSISRGIKGSNPTHCGFLGFHYATGKGLVCEYMGARLVGLYFRRNGGFSSAL